MVERRSKKVICLEGIVGAGKTTQIELLYEKFSPDCYLMPPESTALDFAYRLHTDIGNNFIKAVDVKTKQAVGKDYKLKAGDGLEIMTR